MKKLRYVGPVDEVFNADLMATVKRGDTIEIEDDKLAARLLDQKSMWELATKARPESPAADVSESKR